MSNMGLLGALRLSLALIFLSQIAYSKGKDCKIKTVTPKGPGSVLVKWDVNTSATNYILDLRIINSTDMAPVVVVTKSSAVKEKVVHGLKPGSSYTVTLKVFNYYHMVCRDTFQGSTVPIASGITRFRPLSSTSIEVEWTPVPSADRYYLMVESETGEKFNLTFTTYSTVLENLRPSTTYDLCVITANEAGLGKKSRVKTALTLLPPPLNVTVKHTGRQTARASWLSVEDVLWYKVTVWNIEEPNSRPFVANTSDTHLDIQDIQPCSTYLVSVSSVSTFLQPSESTDYNYTTNPLKPVTSVSVEYSCTNGAVVVSWTAVHGADNYRATAIDNNGTSMSCTSQGTHCQITGLGCSQAYTVHVTAMSESCENTAVTNTTIFQTVPCPPKDLTLSRQCDSNVIIFGWEHTNQTQFYRAKAVDSKGLVQECITPDSSCFFTQTVCGRRYTFTVQSVTEQCSSEISLPVEIRTAPCVAKNVLTSVDCNSDRLTCTWDTADGALNYSVEALGNKGSGTHYSCRSVTNSCTIDGIHCGEHLTIYITASDNECHSTMTLGQEADSAPCPPQNVSASMDCGSNSVTVSWNLTAGAVFYIATVIDSDGAVHTCNSMMLSCQITGLKCSTIYTAFVIASNFRCNSTESERVPVETAPCPPGGIVAYLDCAANRAKVAWQGQPHMISYTATIIDPDGGLLSCSTTGTNCSIDNLKCGQLYSVTVRHHDGICPSMPSDTIYMDSVPCGPENVQASVNCTSGQLTIGWDESSLAEGYTTIISDSNGQKLHFNSTRPLRTVNTLECGREYMVEVAIISGNCLSLPSKSVTIQEVPCVPTNVVPQKNCNGTSVEVTWQASRGAKNYTAIAVGKDGHHMVCWSNMMMCRLEDTMCGQSYNISVVAMNKACSSMESVAVLLQTAPCPPTQLAVTVDCTSNSAMLTWDSSPNAVDYSAKAVGTDGHTVSCEGEVNPRCQLAGLRCGQEYTFTVSASDGTCRTLDSQPVTHITGPCTPESVVNTMDCSTNTLTISWALGSIPLNYSASALSKSGTALSCITEGSRCEMPGLPCGEKYNVTVKAASSTCEGPSSAVETVYTVPCVPANIQGVVECSSNTLRASWDVTAGAMSYISTLTQQGGFSASCPSRSNTCSFLSLQCAQEYTLAVMALNDHCNSSMSTGISAMTAPCDPANVVAVLHCNSGVVTVSWEASAGAVNYTIVAHAQGQSHVTSCDSSSTFCELSQLQCGEMYTVTVLAGDGTCNSTMLANTTIKTAPCAPVIQDHTLDCATNHAWVSWAEDEHAVGFIVNASSNLGHSTSCSSIVNSSCVLSDLRCGQTYTVYAVAQGEKCFSAHSNSFEIVTAPCTSTSVESNYFCGTSMALLTWDETLGRERFHAHIRSADHMDSCDTTETHCSFTSLLCGRVYDVEVDAMAAHCNSSRPATAQIETAPCAPQNVSASLVCDKNTAAVSWLHSTGAVSYNVTAQGRDGDTKRCSTNTTGCHLPNLHCAQTYEITITPFSKSCRGFDSATFIFMAGPCPPTDLQVSLQCDGNVGSVSWTPALAADLYVAKAIAPADDDHFHTCNTTGTGCSFTDLHCFENNTITVVTIERGCQSEPSVPAFLKSAICPPMGVTAETVCGTNNIMVNWNRSPESGVTYYVQSQDESGATTTYTTVETSYLITGLQCGKKLNITLAAEDTVCLSALSQTVEIETVPCPPTNLTAWGDCGTNKGTLTWVQSAGAISYTATVTGTHGHTASCSSNGTSCFVKLDCGHQYSAIVVGSSAACNSSMETSTTFDSAPCLPEGVVADLDCSANSFAVQWMESNGDVSSYTVLAIGSDGSNLTCVTNTTACTINNLRCGLNYSIAVLPSSIDCGTIQGSDYHIQSAPCKPESPGVHVECSINEMMVNWTNGGPDQSYLVTAENSQGQITTCTSTNASCTLSQLSCGEVHTVTVVGFTELCRSEPVSIPNVLTAPCLATHLTANVNCLTGITMVTWDPARGATSYTVFAKASGGQNATCINSDTNCNFAELTCGQDYAITVVPSHPSCKGHANEPISITTVPCPHAGLRTSIDCSTNMALVSWTPGSGILSYSASASGFDITHDVTCSTSGSACNISSLRCGERYRVSVGGQGLVCHSPANEWNAINTAPCPPANLRVESSCNSDSITVSWQASQGSESYKAVAENTQGHRVHCDTNITSCQISGLQCGQKYQVYAAGMNSNCMGTMSDIHMLDTAPCVPHDIQNHLDCLSGVLNVTWQQSGYADHFHATVQSSEGHVTVCNTEELHCVVPNMQCGLSYSVEVEAHDMACNSSHSATQQVNTAPCPPEPFLTTVDCATVVVSVAWNHSAPGVLYTVSAVDISGRWHNCSTEDSGCDLNTLECGTEYNVTITPSRDGCVGRNSSQQLVKTTPCVPHLADVEMDCLSESAWVMWEESTGTDFYIIEVTNSLDEVLRFECNATSEKMCATPNLNCSQRLTFTLIASDQQCASAPSNSIVTKTAPCPPESVQANVSCEDHAFNVSWLPSEGAVMYTATLEGMDGKNTCCTTNDTGCVIDDLPCGEMYVVLVTAEGRTCNSSQSEGKIVRTEPCIPQNLQASLSCSGNVASMSWNYSKGGQQYTVEAQSANGHMVQCRSHENACELTGLSCGQTYTATVAAEHSDCKSKPSNSVEIKTVPCTPENVSAMVDCEANQLIVSWSESSGADSYRALVQDSNGLSTTCQATTEGSCSVTGLSCGKIYHVSVVSGDGYCDSPPSAVVDAHSVPCEVRNIRAMMDCEAQVASLSWHMSTGAVSYRATATTVSGHTITSETNNTHSELGGLDCGQSYSVSIQALGEACNSTANMTGQLLTEPCLPHHIDVRYSLTIGQVQWDMSKGAESYTAVAVTDEGLMASCDTTDTSCAMRHMDCSQIYNVTVTAHNRACHGVSTSTELFSIVTEPCPPQNVQTSLHCKSAVGTVSWEMSFGAMKYYASLYGRDGHSLSCVTSDASCNVEGVHCGTVYYTSVIAMGEEMNSTTSDSVLLVSAPCEANEVHTKLNCEEGTAKVYWSWINGADSYLITATGSEGHRASCETEENNCNVTELMCGQMYNISLTAINDHCQTETLTNVSFSTRPCKTLRVGVDLQCGTSTANLYWEQREGVELYVTTATCSSGDTQQCNSTGSTCQFSNLWCGETYQFTVTAHGSECYGEMSNTVEIQTEPCRPEGVTFSGSCESEVVVLYWSQARGASMYVISAVGDLGYITAFQTNETMLETEMPCGQTFTFTVMAQDDRCDSNVSQPAVFKTAPCVPQHVERYLQCEDSLGSVSWAHSDGAETYTAIAVGLDGHTHICTSNSTTCTFDDLHCGEHYEIHVITNDYLCSSMPSNSTMIRMAPCVPQNLEASLNCTTKMGMLYWNASEGAEYYMVTAATSSGHKVQVSTNDTMGLISDLLCGQNYFLSVQAGNSECRSTSSQPARLKTEPCPPTGVTSSMDCLTNIAVVSWTSSAGADYYFATATHKDGQLETCMSTSQQCGMPSLRCGQNYTVTVSASNEQCSSDPSEEDILQTGPCVPTDVEVTMDCSNNTAVVSWNASQGALSYKVVAQSSHAGTFYCESAGTSCTLDHLLCGQSYLVKVMAMDDMCSSLPSQAKEFNSVPCTPNIGEVVLDCYTNSALLTWSYAEGALFYNVTAWSPSNHVSSCTSNFTNCELAELQCGQNYTVAMVASNGQCDSVQSSSVQVTSVPCRPEDVRPVLHCSSNTAHVEWQASSGAKSYIVHAIGVEEHVSGCETESNSCDISDLLCGFTYNISVTAVNSQCNVSESAITQMQSVPCVPSQVEARVDCELGVMTVSWEPSKGADSYHAIAQGSGGFASTCNSTEALCLFDDLLCGLSYSITVSAANDVCHSAGSSAVELNTVPCVPQRVTADMSCGNDTGLVSWEQGEGVDSYLVNAVGPDGHRTQCSSTTTSCQLPGMHCGQRYNLTVTAQDGVCDNSKAYLTLQSVPCKPTNVGASLLCRSNSAAVTWERASGALSYQALGVTEDGTHQAECNNTMTNCDLTGLLCGQTYNVSVFGQDGFCNSMESNRVYVRTAPCTPQDMEVDVQCAAGVIAVSWAPNPDAESFYVEAVSNTGARLSCNSSGNSCSIENLPCGYSYNVTIVSIRDGCKSKPSPAVEISSAPCVPRNPEGSLDCVTNAAWVSWRDADGALSYYVLAQGVRGHTSNCTSTSSPCSVPDLECGTLYTFHVTAANKHCKSGNSTTFQLETGPCALSSINVEAECHSNMILVSWELTEESPLYLVTAEDRTQTLLTCNSSSTFCELEDARCGMEYTVIVSASSDKCSSLRSPPKKIYTAPCVPEDVAVVATCDTGAVVSWAPSIVATSFWLTATGGDGDVRNCNTSVNNCTLTDLHCGQMYSFSISASSENCTSRPSTHVDFRTVPCEPSGLDVDFQCETNSAVLSWNASEGAVQYFGCAQSEDGDMLYCDGTDTSCTIQGLECGSMYNFSVEASDGTCNTSFSASVMGGAAPCAPANVSVKIRIIDEAPWARTWWSRVNCPDVTYLVEINGQIQNNPQTLMEVSSYWVERPYFEIPMPCSTTYNVTVRSKNSAGVSEPSDVFTGMTVPCPPQSVTYTGDSHSAVLSWEASVLATQYKVYSTSVAGRFEVCSTNELSCLLTNFDPDTTEVTAQNDVGESLPTRDITGPVLNRRRRDLRYTQMTSSEHQNLEVPEIAKIKVKGHSLHVKWNRVKHATEYKVIVREENAIQPCVVMTVEHNSSTLSDLKPWTNYCVQLSARNIISQSSFSKPVCRTTGPPN